MSKKKEKKKYNNKAHLIPKNSDSELKSINYHKTGVIERILVIILIIVTLYVIGKYSSTSGIDRYPGMPKLFW